MTWEELQAACRQCRKCVLCEGRRNVVFGDGAMDAEILLIGEGPGEQEDRFGIPFVGPAGKLLDDMLELTGLDRTKVYIGNVVKCRPPQNRDPLNTEQAMCLPWLRRQTALLRPKIIICLGRIAAKAVIRPNFAISREHGQWFERNGVRMTAIYHPSALLRDPSRRPETFLDLLGIREKVREVCTRTELSLPRAEAAESGQSAPQTETAESGQSAPQTEAAENGPSAPQTETAENGQSAPQPEAAENGQSNY